jgi:hypothetical protein
MWIVQSAGDGVVRMWLRLRARHSTTEQVSVNGVATISASDRVRNPVGDVRRDCARRIICPTIVVSDTFHICRRVASFSVTGRTPVPGHDGNGGVAVRSCVPVRILVREDVDNRALRAIGHGRDALLVALPRIDIPDPVAFPSTVKRGTRWNI